MKKNKKYITMLSLASMIFDARIQREAKALRDAGYIVTILYIEDQQFFYSLPDPEKAWIDYQNDMVGIKSVRIFLRSRRWSWLPSFLNKLFQAIELFFSFSFGVIKHKANVYHCHDLAPAVFAWIGKLVYGAKIVYDAHELEVEVTDANAFIKSFRRWYEKKIILQSSLSITVNRYIADHMEKEYGKPVQVIGNKPFSVAKEKLEKKLLRQKISLPPNSKIVMYVGYLHPKRGINEMVEALAFLDEDIIFLLMGTGRIKEYKTILNKIIAKNNISPERVKFIGPFPPSEVIHYLSGADISVMLYQAQTNNSVINAPNKLFQSIMARVPVIASHNKSFPGYIYDNGIGKIGETVDETNPKLIAKKVESLINASNIDQIKVNIEKYAQEVSWEVEAKKLVKYYSEFVS